MSSARLYVFVGPSGAGKSTLASKLVEAYDGFELCKKSSNRPVRATEVDICHAEIDLRGNEDCLVYANNGGYLYGLDLKHIRSRLDAGISVMVVVNNLTTIRVLRNLIPETKVVLIHRDLGRAGLQAILENRGMGGDRLTVALEQRMVAREILYRQLAGGIFTPDHVVINDTLAQAVKQIRLVADESSKVDTLRAHGPIVYIIMAGSGEDKDFLIRSVETIPGGQRHIIPKYLTRQRRDDDGVETRNVEVIPSSCLEYSFFGKRFGVDVEETTRIAQETGLGFLLLAHVPTATQLSVALAQRGISGRLVYMHQPQLRLDGYTGEELAKRNAHAAELLSLYQSTLVARSDLSVIIAESKEVICDYVQRMYLETLSGRGEV